MRPMFMFRALLAVLLLGVFVLPANAQGEPEFRIQYIALQETSTSQVMKLYFSLTDGNGAPVVNPNFVAVDLTLDTTTPISYQEIKKAEDELYLTLVLDTSGSMARSGDAMKLAVAQMLDQLPQNTHVSVITFNEEYTTLQPFTTDLGQVASAVQSIAHFDGGTCLYDAAHLAVRNFYYEDSTARRAVVLFTDGKDETENSSTCSKHSIDEVIDIATDHTLPVPIFTVGVYPPEVGNADTQRALEALEYIAHNTGGAMYHGTPGNISQLFRQVIGHINNQWVLVAPLCVTSGQHLVKMAVQIASYAVTMEDTQTFTAQTSCYYEKPTLAPDNLSIEIVGIDHDPAQQTLSFSVLPSHALAVPVTYDVRVQDGPFECLHLKQEEPDVTFALSDLACSPQEIVLIVQVMDDQGNILARAESPPIPLAGQDEALSLAIVGKKYDPETRRITFSVKPSDPQAPVDHYIVRVTDEGNFELLTFRTYEAENISFSLDEFRQAPTTGNIIIYVKARDAQGKEIGEAPPENTPLFIPPTEVPVGVTINGVSQVRQSGQDYLALDISLLGEDAEDAIQNIKVEVVHTETGEQHTFTLAPASPLLVSTAGFRPGVYEITVTAQSATAPVLQPSTFTVTYIPAVELSLNIYTDPRTRSFMINLEGRNLDVVAQYEVIIIRETGISLTPEALSFVPSAMAGNRIAGLDLYRLAQDTGVVDGETLTVRVKALGTSGEVLTEAEKEFVYISPETAAALNGQPQTAVSEATGETSWIKENKYVLVAILVLLLVFIGIWSFRSKAGNEGQERDDRTLREPPEGLKERLTVKSIPVNEQDLAINSFECEVSDGVIVRGEHLDGTTMEKTELYIGRQKRNPQAQFFYVSDRHLLKEGESSSISRSHLKVTYVEASDSYRIDVLSQNGAQELDQNYRPQRFLRKGDALEISQSQGMKRLLLGEKICVEFERGGTRKVPLPPSLSPDGSQTLPVDTGGAPTTNDR